MEVLHDEFESEIGENQKLNTKIDRRGIGMADAAQFEMMDTTLAVTRFQELREKENLKLAVGKLGKNSYFIFKITSIIVKLMINVSVGVVFYILLVGLSDNMSYHLAFFNNATKISMGLLQISYLNMEKILWKEDRLSFTAYENSLASVFSQNDNLCLDLLNQTEKFLTESSRLVDNINLETSNNLWYNSKIVKIFKLGQDQPSVLSGKEGLNVLLSNAIVHVGKPAAYYNRTNADLLLFFMNVRTGLYNATSTLIRDVNASHENYAKTRLTLLLSLLIGKVGLGLLFVASAMILYFKENKKKEEVISLFYSFLPADVKAILKQNESLISIIITKDFVDNDTGLAESRILEAPEIQYGKPAEEDEDEDQNQLILIAKRNKRRGSLDRMIEFDKFFIVFFALINTLYFVFLYVWNDRINGEYSNLVRLTRENNLQTVELNAAFNKLMTTQFFPLSSTLPYSDLKENTDSFLKHRKNTVVVEVDHLGNAGQQVQTNNSVRSAFPRVPSRQLRTNRQENDRRRCLLDRVERRCQPRLSRPDDQSDGRHRPVRTVR